MLYSMNKANNKLSTTIFIYITKKQIINLINKPMQYKLIINI